MRRRRILSLMLIVLLGTSLFAAGTSHANPSVQSTYSLMAFATPDSIALGESVTLIAGVDPDEGVSDITISAPGLSRTFSGTYVEYDWKPTSKGLLDVTFSARDSQGSVLATESITVYVTDSIAYAASAIVSPSTIEIGQSTTVYVQAEPADRISRLEVEDFYGPIDTVIGDSGTVTWQPTSTGSQTVWVHAYNMSDQLVASDSAWLTVESPNYQVSAVASPATIIVGQATRIDVQAQPTVGVSYFKLYNAANGSYMTRLDGAAASFLWTPPATGTYTVRAWAYGPSGESLAYDDVLVTVNQQPVAITTFSASPNSATLGGAVTLTLQSTPASRVATMKIFEVGTGALVAGPFTGTAGSASWTPQAAKTYTLRAVAYDAVGQTLVTRDLSVVVSAPASYAVTASAAPNPATVGQAITISASTSPTTLGISKILITNKATGAAVGSQISGGSGSTTWTPTAAGTYTLNVKAFNAAGSQVALKELAVTVTPPACPITFTSLTDPIALRMEAGESVIWDGPRITELSAAKDKFEQKAALYGWTLTYTSAYRPQQYQQHLYEIWQAQRNPALNLPECAQVKAHVARHAVIAKPCYTSTCPHVQGRAFDVVIMKDGVVQNPKGATTANADVAAAATYAGLTWLWKDDPVHFQLPITKSPPEDEVTPPVTPPEEDPRL